MLNRSETGYLSDWIGKKNRKPLVLRGARQVGKSCLVKNFSAEQNLVFAEINCDLHPELDIIAKEKNVDAFLRECALIAKLKGVWSENTLLFLDEIQAAPHVMPLLRYLYEDKQFLPIVAAGSLLEFVLADHSFSMPVGRIEYCHLGTFRFSDFLNAMGDEHLVDALDRYKLSQDFSPSAHKELIQRYKEYLWIGGLPECVSTYSETKNLNTIQQLKASIVQTYIDDFPKYRTRIEPSLLLRVLRYAALNIGRKAKYSAISSEHQSKSVKRAIEVLSLAKLIQIVPASHANAAPLGAELDDSGEKLFLIDCGLVTALTGQDWRTVKEANPKDWAGIGGLTEQFIAQHLSYLQPGYMQPELFYWHKEAKTSNAEVDFVITRSTQIIPVEVKSGTSGSLKSLQEFVKKKSSSLCLRFDLNLPSLQNFIFEGNPNPECKLLTLPCYLVEHSMRLLEEAHER